MKNEEALDSHIIHLALGGIIRELNKTIIICNATLSILEEKGIVTREEIDEALDEQHDKFMTDVKKIEAKLIKKYGKDMEEFEKLVQHTGNIVGDA